MNCFIIAATSLDGYIAQLENDSSFSWTSPEDKKFFIERTKKAKVVVFGKKTFETIKKPLKERLNIVYSNDLNFKPEGVEITQKNPCELLTELERRGFSEVAICGGASIYTLFMESGCVNEIYLTLEPIIFGSGIKLFNKQINYKFQLLEFKKLNDFGTLLLRYKVLK
ncbi:MAG: dihydrofolate reductase family protein [Minisyncoccia bacterium]